jgi:ATP-binding cassette, subfamily B, bacterial
MADRVPFVPAMELAECGAACLAMVLALHGKHVPRSEGREVNGTGRDGVDAQRLLDAAHFYGLAGWEVRAELDPFQLLPRGGSPRTDVRLGACLRGSPQEERV